MAKKYCINCGKLVPVDAKFCSFCGAPQQGIKAGKFRAEDPTIDIGRLRVDEQVSTARTESEKSRSEKENDWKKYYESQRLGKSAITAFFIAYVAKTSILLPLFIVGIVFEPVFVSLGLALYLVLIYVVSLTIYSNFYYWVDDHSFHKSSGIIHKQDVSIPYQQIQNVNINRSFTDRLLGLSRISIETAGNNKESGNGGTTGSVTASAEGYLPGVDLKTAKEVHDLLLTRADEAN